MPRSPALVLAAVGALSSGAMGAITITQGASAPTYSQTLNFDEVGGPTGSAAPGAWASIGLSSFVGGASNVFVSQVNTNPGFGWAGTGNVAYGTFGLFMNFSQDLTAFSAQYWDSSGHATFMGGGAIIVALNDGVEVGSLFLTDPAFGGVGQEWVNFVATGSSVFDEVRLVGFGFFPEAYADNMSWNTIPSPGAAALLPLCAMAMNRRRR